MLRGRLFPQREIHLVFLFFLTGKPARVFQRFFDGAPRQLSVTMVSVVFHHVEIYRSVFFVGIAGLKDFFHHVDLFDDVP